MGYYIFALCFDLLVVTLLLTQKNEGFLLLIVYIAIAPLLYLLFAIIDIIKKRKFIYILFCFIPVAVTLIVSFFLTGPSDRNMASIFNWSIIFNAIRLGIQIIGFVVIGILYNHYKNKK